MIKIRDFVLITDETDIKFLNMAYIVNIYYDYCGSAVKYHVLFPDKTTIDYGYDLPNLCKVIMFER